MYYMKKEEIKFKEPELEEAYQRVLRKGIFDKLKKNKVKSGLFKLIL